MIARARLLLVLLVAMALGPLSDAAVGQPAGSREIAPQGKLRVATIGSNPVLFMKKEGGGVAMDVGRFLAGKLGVTFEPVVYPGPSQYRVSFGKTEWDIAIGPREVGGDAATYGPDLVLVDNVYVGAPGRTFADSGQVDRAGVKIAVIDGGVPHEFLRRSVKSALLVAVANREAGAEALSSKHADVFGSNIENVQAVAAAVTGSTIVAGPFLSVPMAVGLPKGRSTEAQARLTDLVNEAKTTGLVKKAIEAAQLKGVRVAEGSRP
jgi:polar amino acid transport system substrate-binding protein